MPPFVIDSADLSRLTSAIRDVVREAGNAGEL
jgi:adenosylmethionine-8-amino-7-oxononanoate aminotransferase